MSDIQAILFDNDGTLVDTYDAILSCFQYATQKVLHKAIPDEELMAKVGQPLRVQMWDFTDNPETHQALCDAYWERGQIVHDECAHLFEGVAETLSALQERGFVMGVVTSKLHGAAQHGLKLFGIDQYFDCLVCPDDCEGTKPNPAPVIYGAQLLGIDPSRCLYVGDSPFDMQAGNGAGCITVACLWGMFDKDTLSYENPDYMCAKFSDLLNLEVLA